MHSSPPSLKNILFLSLSLFVSGSFAFLLYSTVSAQFTPPCDTPPNCQPSTGSVTATLLDVLKNGSTASSWGKSDDLANKGFVGIGGGLNEGGSGAAGEIRFGIGTTTPGFPLDVIAQTSGNPDNDTANLRLAYNTASPVWTGVKLDRKAGDEKWFVGMSSSSDNLVIRSGSNANVVEIPPGKGAACFGAQVVGLSGASYTADLEGYKAANTKCNATFSGSHVCSTEEMFRTQVCNLGKFSENGINGQVAWISNGPSSHPDIGANDCNAWTTNDVASYGGYWEMNANGGTPLLSTCDFIEGKFACCR